MNQQDHTAATEPGPAHPPRTAFVTGATGFLGLNLVRLLGEAGWEVVALHRPQSDLKYLQRFPARRASPAMSRYLTWAGAPGSTTSTSRCWPRTPCAPASLRGWMPSSSTRP